jgi:Fe-S oxidoreductase
MAEKNIEAINSCGVRKIVTTCPHCFNTLAQDYRELGMNLPVEHHSTFISHLITDKQLKLQLNLEPAELTYHDSCYMGRYRDVIQEPRAALKAVGGRLIEMEKSGYDSFCCGAGGGRILCEETIGTRINLERVRMAASTGAATLVSNCPFCLTMFEDGIKTSGLEKRLVVKDLAEVIVEHIAVTGSDVSILQGGTHEAAGLHETGSRSGITVHT